TLPVARRARRPGRRQRQLRQTLDATVRWRRRRAPPARVGGLRQRVSPDETWVGTDPIDIARVAASVHDEALGGVGMFLGRVRSPNGGHVVHHLDYEGYEDMILGTMAAIADELRAEH